MAYQLTKRIGHTGAYAFSSKMFEFFDDCLNAALPDDADFIIQDEHGIVDYRTGGIRKSN
jgi:hypothetical protein